jgi:hypothetical protein
VTGKTPRLLILCSLLVLLGGCGYYFPHVYDGPEKAVYMPNWKNRTDKLGLDNVMYQSLSVWFQKSDAIRITKDRANADLILAGEIVSIDLPSIGWNDDARSTDVKITLVVRYVLKDLKTGKILWEVPNDVLIEDYNTLNQNAGNEEEALAQIVDDISEKIYMGTLNALRRENMGK